jgi:8-oxo-dGTP pyrophosphatase MutT (NUDIX family)
MKRPKNGNGKGRATRPIQYGALPYREIKSGVQILLVTSRGTRRWIIPKGWPQRGMPAHRAAALEAFEEAGVVGKVSKKTVGSYWYDKIFESGSIRCARAERIREGPCDGRDQHPSVGRRGYGS